jgi:hypothetical protein
MVKQIGNPYFIAAIAVIGGALFGFDISSMSAIIATQVGVGALTTFCDDLMLKCLQPYKCPSSYAQQNYYRCLHSDMVSAYRHECDGKFSNIKKHTFTPITMLISFAMYYIAYVLQMAGLSVNNLLVSSSIQYVINVVMTTPGLLLVDRVGRRPLLLVGAALMALWLFANAGILGAYGTYPGPGGVGGNTPEASTEVTGAASKAVIACSYLFVASLAPTWGSVRVVSLLVTKRG